MLNTNVHTLVNQILQKAFISFCIHSFLIHSVLFIIVESTGKIDVASFTLYLLLNVMYADCTIFAADRCEPAPLLHNTGIG